jgi:hypothetical protein
VIKPKTNVENKILEIKVIERYFDAKQSAHLFATTKDQGVINIKQPKHQTLRGLSFSKSIPQETAKKS